MHPRSRVLMLRISWRITRFLTAKRLYIVAQGKRRRVLRAFVSPWVKEARDPRPRTQRFFRRRVIEAEACRGFFAASADRRPMATVSPRPRPSMPANPGRRQYSQDSHCLALGYVV
jgi:hypothetical protein